MLSCVSIAQTVIVSLHEAGIVFVSSELLFQAEVIIIVQLFLALVIASQIGLFVVNHAHPKLIFSTFMLFCVA